MCRMVLQVVSLIAAVLAANPVKAALTVDHFNYGGASLQLVGCSGGTGLNGGENWGSYWAGYCGLSPMYSPAGGLSYSQSCYSDGPWQLHEGNDPNSGGPVFQSYRLAWRYLPQTLTGVVWMSALIQRRDTDAYVVFGDYGHGPATFAFGMWGNGYASVEFTGHGLAQGPRKLQLNTTYLLLARLEFDYNAQNHDRITLWIDVNPLNTCGGEAGLGVPEVSLGGIDIVGGWGVLSLDMADSRTDAFRLSHGPDASLAEAVYSSDCTSVETGTWGRIKNLFR